MRPNISIKVGPRFSSDSNVILAYFTGIDSLPTMRGWPPTTAAPLSPMSTNNGGGTDPWKLPANVSWDAPKATGGTKPPHSRSSPAARSSRFGARGRMMEGSMNHADDGGSALYDDSGNKLGSPRRPIAVDDITRSFDTTPTSKQPGFLEFWKQKSGSKATTTTVRVVISNCE